jgi:hypothetical protein
VLADRAYDADWIRDVIDPNGMGEEEVPNP